MLNQRREPMMATTYFPVAGPSWWLGKQDTRKPPATSPKPSRYSTAKSRHNRVLIVDDEPLIADSLVEILTNRGYEAVACYDGQTAIETAQTWCPDLLLSDIVMPRLNGVDTAVAIQELCPATRAVLFSGQARTPDLLAQARANGHQFELLYKPIHPEQLLKKLG